MRIVRRRAFGPLVPIQERDVCRCAPFALVPAELAPDGLPVALPPGDQVPDDVAAAELDDTPGPVDSDVPLTPDPGALAIDGDDPPSVGVAVADGVDVTDPVVGRVGVGGGFGRVVDGAGGSFGRVVDGGGGSFGTVVDGGGGSFGTVTVEVGRGRVGVVTVMVVTPGMGTETAVACPARRPQAANPIRTAAVLIWPQLHSAENGCGLRWVGNNGAR